MEAVYDVSQHPVLNWVKDFLSNRPQYVSVNGERLASMPVSVSWGPYFLFISLTICQWYQKRT